ncbi:MAG: S-layer homology domain-containing protein [Candidatus Gracilibacteria bacterium]|jgi:uncharacterized repeat protein (TIGR01451 family)
MSEYKNIQRVIAGLILFFLNVQILEVPLSKAAQDWAAQGQANAASAQGALSTIPSAKAVDPNQNPATLPHLGIIAILVDDDLMNNKQNYAGLTAQYAKDLNTQLLSDRVHRYAIDAQSSQPNTKSLIIKTSPTSKVEDIANSLEKLYLEGDGSKGKITNLVGVVTIGDVPLPVVNKNGYRFVSMMPYTDFEDKVYIFDAASSDYLPNPNLKFAKEEVWQGVIKPPLKGEEGNNLLASYFDKNHLYHAGNADYSVFDKKLLFADLYNEFKSMNKLQFNSYLRYLAHWADFAYLRFNKHLADQFLQEVTGKLKEQGVPTSTKDAQATAAKQQAELNQAGIPSDGLLTPPCDKDCEDAKSKNPKLPKGDNNVQAAPSSTNSMPDIQTRTLILNFVSKYVQLFDKFLSTINDWANYTGRYKAAYEDGNGNTLSDIHSIPALISIKDQNTSEYFKQVNDSIESAIDQRAQELQNSMLMIQNVHLSGQVLLSGQPKPQDLLPWDFVNFSEHTFGNFKTLSVNGVPAFAMQSTADCSIYRGSNNNGTNSVMTKSIKIYNPKSASQSENFADDIVNFGGCLGNNYSHPERCFPEAAIVPVFDLVGSKEVDPATVPESATNYRACYDFKEKNNFAKYIDQVGTYLKLFKLLKDDPTAQDSLDPILKTFGSSHLPTSQIFIFISPNVFITLADVLKKLNIPADDWGQIGEGFLANLKQNQYVLNNPFPGVDSLTINLTAEAAVDNLKNAPIILPTISYHKEPTADVHNKPYTSINEQLQAGGFTESLPSDNPRYVAFQDKQGYFQKIYYPDAFSAKSYNDYLKSLQDTENKILDLYGKFDVNLAQKNEHFLTKLLGEQDQQNAKDKSIFDIIGAAKLTDAFSWKDLNIDQKHNYVFTEYLGAKADPYVEKMKSGYEAMYFVSRGSTDTFQTQFNGDYPEDDKDLSLDSALHPANTPETSPSDAGYAKAKEEGEGIFIFEWFKEIVKWVKETTNKLSATIQLEPVCGVNDGKDPETGGAGVGQGPVSQTANTSRLMISANKNVLKTGSGDTLTLTVVGVDNKNIIQAADSQTMVDLTISKSNGQDVVTIASTHPMQLSGGRTTFMLQATDVIGNVTVNAFVQGKKITSNTVPISSTKGSIRLLSYVRTTGVVYAEKVASGFIIKDANGNVIAEVDGKTGMVTIKDDRYQLLAQPSEGAKPVRLSVQQKTGDLIVASVFFAVDGKQPILIDGPDVDYLKSFADLAGVHLKDLSNKDDYSAQKSSNSFNKNGIYLYEKNGNNQNKFGIIDTLGNVYLAAGFGFQMKSPAQGADPVIFQILGKDNKALFEIYLGIQNPTVQILKPEGDYAAYNTLNKSQSDFNEILLQGAFKLPTGSESQNSDLWNKGATAGVIPDSDNDGLNDLQELLIGTNPKNADTNGDLIKDGDEINKNLSPFIKDTALFKDLTPAHEAFNDILKLYKRGIISGYADGTFKPERLLSREEFVKLDLGAICIYCTKLSETVKKSIDAVYNQSPFPDKNFTPNLLYCVKEAKNRSIVSGYKGGNQAGYYLPTNSISRAEASKIILETARQQGNSKIAVDPSIPDGKPWYYNYVLTTQKEHFYPNGRFKELDTLAPAEFKTWFDAQLQQAASGQSNAFVTWISGGITRAEFSIMVSRLINKTDCFADDQDHEGLSDNLEKYVYGSSPTNPDTDNGGVDDFTEVVNQMNPLDKKDDNDSDGDGMPNSFEVKYGLNPFDPTDTNKDKDFDGLTNLEEYQYGTDPSNPDTDGGGVNDGDEVLQKINPLDAKDDFKNAGAKNGSYIVGDNIFDNYVFDQQTPPANTSSINFEDQVPADGKSKLFLRAEVLNDNGDIDTAQNGTVKIYRKTDSGNFAKISPDQVKLQKGVAESEITASTHAGEYVVNAELNGKKLPVDDKSIFVTPLDPAKIEIKVESASIKSGGLSNTIAYVYLEDVNGNIVNNGTNQLTFTVDGPGLITTGDEDPQQDGIQLSSVSGEFEVMIASQKDPGQITLKATYQAPIDELVSPELAAGTQAVTHIYSRDDLHLTLIPANGSIPSDYSTVTSLQASVLDKNNQVVKNFNGVAQFALLDPQLGKLVSGSSQAVKNGQAQNAFQASNKAGDANISVTINGFDPANAIVKTAPKEAKKIVLEAASDTIESNPSSIMEVIGKLYDTDNNLVTNNSTTQVTIRLTDATKPYGLFDNQAVQAKNGIVKFALRGTGKTGPINIIASAKGLLDGGLQLQSVNNFKADDLKNINPQVLFAAVLGSAFGDTFKDNYLGGWFLFSGKTQSVLSLMSDPKPHLGLVQVDYSGRIKALSSDRLESKIIPGNAVNQPTRVIYTDTLTSQNIAEVFAIAKPQTAAKVLAAQAPVANLAEGIYLQNLSDTQDYSVAQAGDSVSLVNKGNEAVKIFNNGAVKIFDNNFALKYDPAANDAYFILQIYDGGVAAAQIIYAYGFSGDVQKLPFEFAYSNQANYQPGVYVHMLDSGKQFELLPSFSGNSTALPQGALITDTSEEMANTQAPGLSYSSIETAADNPGVGFQGDNKFMLLFSAGNSVGEANVPYASEIGVVLGDPTVRLNNKINVSKTGFTQDIGQEIYFGNAVIQEMQPIDYNSDGNKDLVVAYQDGKMRLLQNTNSYPRFTDKGVLLNFPNGIISFTVGDFNKDNQPDIVVASQDSCRKGEICIDEYVNNNGNFVRNHLKLQGFTDKNRINMIRSGDMNSDGYADLVTSDDAGVIRVFYNRGGSFDKGQFIGSLGVHIAQNDNLKTEVLVAYDGMPKVDPKDSNSELNFRELPVQLPRSGLSAADQQAYDEALNSGSDAATITSSPLTDQTQTQFLFADVDPALFASEKRAKDLTPPLDTLARGDEVAYTITLKNSGNNDLQNVMVSDVVPTSMEIEKDTITCNDCGKETMRIGETGESLRPYIFSGFSIPKKGERTITYKSKVKTTPRVKIYLGQNLDAAYPQDNFMDIGAAPDGNNTGRMTYFYSISQNQVSQEMNYGTYVSPPPDPKLDAPPPPADPLGIGSPTPSMFELKDDDGIPIVLKDYQDKQNGAPNVDQTISDEDSDGLSNSWDDFNQGLNDLDAGISNAADGIQGAIAMFTCGGGCIPMPVNFAFLATGSINVMGLPLGFDPGLPVFGWGAPYPPFLWPGSPYQTTLGGRIYLSPTATMSLGVGVCIGPYPVGLCWAISVPPVLLGMAGMCEAISGGIGKAFAGVNNAIQSVNNLTISSDGTPPDADSSGRSETGGVKGSATLGNYQYKASVGTNFRIPGFPAFITKWISDQTSEIINKLTDLPDFYFLYPDPTSIIGMVVPTDEGQQSGNSKRTKSFTFPSFSADPFKDKSGLVKVANTFNPNKILAFMNSLPLIQIEAKEVTIKIPALSDKEIEKFKADAQQWVEDERNEVNRVLALWGCGKKHLDASWNLVTEDGDYVSPYQTMCDKLLLNMTDLKGAIEKNIAVIEAYKELPRQILAWRNIYKKYLTQIICYIDAIIQFTGGYIKKQQSRIMLWIKMIKEVKELIETWKAILDLIINYQATCDRCSNARFTLVELILRLFAIIPAPPVIPFPKWPDIYLDLSQVKTGLKILWPDVKFIPERLILPKIPRLILPDLPTLTLNLPEIPVIPGPPKINLDLPDLPPLPLPSLPDIPPPPKVPGIPAQVKIVINIIKTILRIWCMIKKGLLPVPELMLKGHIEQMTERSLSPLLPIDLGIKLQFPPIKYESLDRIEIIGKTNFQLEFGFIYDFVNNLAEKWNSLATDLVNLLNKKVQDAAKAAQSAADAANKAAKEAVPGGNIDVGPGGVNKSSSLMQLIGSIEHNYVADSGTMSDIAEIKAMAQELGDTGTSADVNALSVPVENMTNADLDSILKQLEQNDPYLGSALKELKIASKDLEKTAKDAAENNKEIEKDIHLTATETYLSKDDPLLNRSLSDVKSGIALQDLPTLDVQNKMVAMRDAFISYSDDQTSANDQINQMQDLESIGRFLAQAKPLQDYLKQDVNGENRGVAAIGSDSATSSFTTSLNPSSNSSKGFNAINDQLSMAESFGSFAEDARKKFTEGTRYLAAVSGPPDTAGNFTPQVIPKGLYIYNPVDQINERLIKYTAEVDQPAQMAFIDANADSDEDFFYAYGSNIYMKENYKIPDVPTFYAGDPKEYQLSDILPAAPEVNNFETVLNNNKNIELTWNMATYSDVSGYEIAYGLTPDTFAGAADEPSNLPVHKIGALIDSAILPNNEDQVIKAIIKKGTYQINGVPPAADGLVTADQPLQTDDGSEVELNYSASAKVTVPGNVMFRPPTISGPQMVAANVQGDVFFSGPQRTILLSGSNKFQIPANASIHAMTATALNFYVKDQLTATMLLPLNAVFQVSKNYTDPISIQVQNGGIEVVNPDKIVPHQRIINGLIMDYDLPITSENGGTANVLFANGSYMRVDVNEDLTFKKLNATDTPDLKLELPNGFYYARIRSFDHLGSLGTVSSLNLLAPTICADKSDPFPNGGESERTVSIFKTLKIDSSKSFAPDGKIILYYLDTDLTKDSDNNGDLTDDKNMGHDLDTHADSDGDGITNNDLDAAVFELGPYTDLKDREVMLNVVDEGLNRAQQKITIHVVVPNIKLDPETATQGKIQGSINMPENNIPIAFVRDRGGVLTPIQTKSANSNGKYFTDDNGKFVVNDLNLKDTIVIKNSQGQIIGEVDPNTGKVILKDNRYHLEVLPAERPLLPTRIVTKETATGLIINTMLLIPDANTDTTIDKPDLVYNSTGVGIFNGVHAKDGNTFDEFEYNKIPSDDANYPGGIEITETTTKKRAAILDTGGNFYVLDSRLSLRLKDTTSLEDPLVIEIVLNKDSASTVIGEFYVAVHSTKGLQMLPKAKFQSYVDQANSRGPLYDSDNDGMPDQWELIYGLSPKDPTDAGKDNDNDGLTNLEEYRASTSPLNPDTNGDGISDGDELKYGRAPGKKLVLPYSDIAQNHPYYESIFKLWIRRIFEGIPGWGKQLFEPDSYLTRAEYADLMLKIFCIIPRKEAYDGPSPFNDVPYVKGQLPWYYAIIKEAFFQGFVTGYLKDAKQIPYKPNGTISRAEAVKVILEALQKQGVIEMGQIPALPAGTPYYAPYMQIAQDLTPYLKKAGSVKKPFIVTADEAARPEDPLTRAGFLAMADRVLTTSDCSVLDDDHDGMPSHWELLNGLNPHNASDAAKDPDRDNLTNLEEYKHGTDPHNPDTDAGGVNDGDEVKKNGTFPLDPADDHSQPLISAPANLPDPRSDLTEGVYIIQDPCATCPCPSAIDHTADLIVGDKVFGLISNNDKLKPIIYSKSNEVEITEIPQPDAAATSHVIIEKVVQQ